MRISKVLLNLLLNVGLMVVAATVATDADRRDDSPFSYRLPAGVTPLHYNIDLEPHIADENMTFSGLCRISLQIHDKTQNISLHVHKLKIYESSVALNSFEDNYAYKPEKYIYKNAMQILTLAFNRDLSPGLYYLRIRYAGFITNDTTGFIRTRHESQYGDAKWVFTTQLQLTMARQLFPCWDEPALKATFNISVVHPRDYVVLSNMPVRESSILENGTVRSEFNITPVMSTYQVAIAVVQFVRISNQNETIDMWLKPDSEPGNAKYAHRVTQVVSRYLTWYTNSTIGVPKVDLVVVADYAIEATGKWGLIIYKEQLLTKDEDSLDYKLAVSLSVAREIIHQWFSDAATPSWWDHMWLRTGLASFFQHFLIDKIFNDWRAMDLFVVRIQQLALRQDALSQMKPIVYKVEKPEEIEALDSSTNHMKASAIIRMVQHVISEDVFRNGIMTYLNRYQYKSVTSDDFWMALQEALDKSQIPLKSYKLKEKMDTWLTQTGYPVITVTRDYDTGDTMVKQKHVSEEEDADYSNTRWWIPVTYTTESNPDFLDTSPKFWLNPVAQDANLINIDRGDWVIVNVQQVGYYRVNYDSTNWLRIAKYLNDRHTNIHVLNRAQLIDDAYHFLLKKELEPRVFIALISYLSQETDYIPWHSMFKILDHMSDFFNYPECSFFKSRVLQMLNGLLKNIGYEEDFNNDNITKSLRVSAAEWACKLGDTNCIMIANGRLHSYLEKPEEHIILPWWKNWTYCAGMMYAKRITWDEMMMESILSRNNKILEYMTCCTYNKFIIRYLRAITNNKDPIIEQQYVKLYRTIIQRHATNSGVLNYILARFDALLPRELKPMEALSEIINNLYSEKDIKKIRQFIRDPKTEHQLPVESIENMLEKRSAEIKRNLDEYMDRFTIKNQADHPHHVQRY